MKTRCIDWYDIHLRLPDQGVPTRHHYGEFRYSGPLCIQFACLHGANRVYLVGCDGYRTGANHPFDGSYFDFELRTKPLRIGWADNATREVIQPGYQHLVTLWPDVEFVCVGDPSYAIQGENWKVLTLDAIAAKNTGTT